MWDYEHAIEVPECNVNISASLDLRIIRSHYLYKFQGPEVLHCTQVLSFITDKRGVLSQLSINIPSSAEKLAFSDLKGNSIEYRQNRNPNPEYTHTLFLDNQIPLTANQIITIKITYEINSLFNRLNNLYDSLQIDLRKNQEVDIIIEGDRRYSLKISDIFATNFSNGDYSYGIHLNPLPLNKGISEDYVKKIHDKNHTLQEEEIRRTLENIDQNVTKKTYTNSIHYKATCPIPNVIFYFSLWQEVKTSKVIWYVGGIGCGIIVVLASFASFLLGEYKILLPLQGTAITLLAVIRGWIFTEHQDEFPNYRPDIDDKAEIRMRRISWYKYYLKYYNIIFLFLVCFLIIFAVFGSLLSIQPKESAGFCYFLNVTIFHVFE